MFNLRIYLFADQFTDMLMIDPSTSVWWPAIAQGRLEADSYIAKMLEFDLDQLDGDTWEDWREIADPLITYIILPKGKGRRYLKTLDTPFKTVHSVKEYDIITTVQTIS